MNHYTRLATSLKVLLHPRCLWLFVLQLALWNHSALANDIVITKPLDTTTTELLMIEERGCVYCAKFNREIAPAYPKTSDGQQAPLRRIDLHSAWPVSLDHIERPRFTPTFILLHNNQEVGRLLGYNGDEFFWFLLSELLQQIEQPDNKAKPESKQ